MPCIDGEMPATALQERLNASQAASPPIVSLQEDQRAIEAEIKDVDLLVLDNLSTLVNGGRENTSWLVG